MDQIISQLAMSTVSMVGKAAFGAASNMAMRQISSYIQNIAAKNTKDNNDLLSTSSAKNLAVPSISVAGSDTSILLGRLRELQHNFEFKVSILTPIIDLIDMAGARGNSALTAIMPLTAHLKCLMDDFVLNLEQMSSNSIDNVSGNDEQVSSLSERLASTRLSQRRSTISRRLSSLPPTSASSINYDNVETVCNNLEKLIQNFDSHIPYLQLALTASGVSFGINLAAHISLSRLLSASRELGACNDYIINNSTNSATKFVLVGKKIPIKLYTLFFGSIRTKSNIQWTWKEKFPSAFLWLERVNDCSKFKYYLSIERNSDDGLVHDNDETDYEQIRIPITFLRRMFYSNAGRLLKIEDSLSPCLIVKYDDFGEIKDHLQGNSPKSRISDKSFILSTPKTSPKQQNWYAFEYHNRDTGTETKEEEDDEKFYDVNSNKSSGKSSNNDETSSTSTLSSESDIDEKIAYKANNNEAIINTTQNSCLSELEYLIKLANLENIRQESHVSVSDEILRMHLESDDIAATYE